MPNGLYSKGRERFLKGEISWNTDEISAVLVKGTYVVDVTTHEFLQDVPVADRVAELHTNLVNGTQLLSKTTLEGVAGAADIRFDEVTGEAVTAVILYKRTAANQETTSPLIAFIDTGAGLPVTPTGVDIEVKWNTGPDKVFRL